MLRGKGKSLLRTKRSVERTPLRRRLPLWRFPATSAHGNGRHGIVRRLRRKTPGARRLQYIGRVNGRPLRTFRPMEGKAPIRRPFWLCEQMRNSVFDADTVGSAQVSPTGSDRRRRFDRLCQYPTHPRAPRHLIQAARRRRISRAFRPDRRR